MFDLCIGFGSVIVIHVVYICIQNYIYREHSYWP